MMSIACVLEQMAITVLREQWKCIVMDIREATVIIFKTYFL